MQIERTGARLLFNLTFTIQSDSPLRVYPSQWVREAV